MGFQERCVHCEHYHNGVACCFCKKEFTPLKKTTDQHRNELKEILDEEHSIEN